MDPIKNEQMRDAAYPEIAENKRRIEQTMVIITHLAYKLMVAKKVQRANLLRRKVLETQRTLDAVEGDLANYDTTFIDR
jgi:hypothetical protein